MRGQQAHDSGPEGLVSQAGRREGALPCCGTAGGAEGQHRVALTATATACSLGGLAAPRALAGPRCPHIRAQRPHLSHLSVPQPPLFPFRRLSSPTHPAALTSPPHGPSERHQRLRAALPPLSALFMPIKPRSPSYWLPQLQPPSYWPLGCARPAPSRPTLSAAIGCGERGFVAPSASPAAGEARRHIAAHKHSHGAMGPSVVGSVPQRDLLESQAASRGGR